MKETTIWDKIKEPFYNLYNLIEYYFAKKWLDKHFGKQEYWGDYLMEKLEDNFSRTGRILYEAEDKARKENEFIS